MGLLRGKQKLGTGRRGGRLRFFGRLVVAVVLLLLLLGGALAVYPFWIGPAAKPLARHWGLEYRNLERLDGGRFALNEVSLSNRVVWATAARVESFWPHVWVRKRGATNETFMNVNGWKLRFQRQPEAPKGRWDVPEAFEDFEEALAWAREWAPKATLLNGAILAGAREHTFSVITWDGGILEADGVWPENATPVEIRGRFAEEPYQLSFAMHPLDLRFRLRAFETNGGVVMTLNAFYKESRADAHAEFVEGRSGPVRAWLKAPEVRLPGQILGLPDYREVLGSAAAEWSSNRFELQLAGTALPDADRGAGSEAAPFELRAAGDAAGVIIEKLESSLKGMEASLSGPLEIGRDGVVIAGSANLDVGVSAGLISRGKTQGRVEAQLFLEPGSQFPFWPD